MKFRNLLILAGLCIAGPALAKTPPSQLPQAPTPAAHHESADAPKPAAAADQSTAPPAAKIDPAKEAAIRHLMDITQTSKLGENMATYISGQVRTFMSHSVDPQALPKFMDSFNQKFAASAPSQNITDAMVPIYDRAFTTQQIQQLVQFYESPLGQHVVKVLPQVLQDSQNTAAKIDQDAALNVLRSMSDDYPQLKSMLPAANQPAPEAAPAQEAPPAAPQH
jgi:uncharacterized protein